MAGARERAREQLRDDVKRVAAEQLAVVGPSGISVNAIARELGLSGPALYRYFANREALLTELVLDAYVDLTTAVTGKRSLGGFAAAYRAWARAHPHRYRLLYTEATPGYNAHQERLATAAQLLMDRLTAVLGETGDRALIAWARIHGFVSLEIDGNFAAMGVDADRLFRTEITQL